MRTRWWLAGFAAVVVGCGGLDPGATPQATATGTDALTATAQQDLAAARAATAKYHRVEVAVADGFLAASPCVVDQDGAVMGIHYVNFERLLDPALSPSEPEALLYVPDASGALRLVAVEYIRPIFVNGAPYVSETVPPPDSAIPETPVLFGQAFQGPMPGHSPPEPWHFDLHVWVWHHNPDGLFALFNPALSCG